MNLKIKILILFPLMILSMAQLHAEFQPGEGGLWKINHYDDTHLVLTGVYTEFYEKCFRQEQLPAIQWGQHLNRKFWDKLETLNMAGAKIILKYRPGIAKQLQKYSEIRIKNNSGAEIPVEQASYWINPIGQARFPGPDHQIYPTRNADTAHYLFLTLKSPLTPRTAYTIHLPTGEQLAYSFEPEKNASALFKYNQLGYAPNAPEKYAYLGAWLGDAGAFPLTSRFDQEFALCRAEDGKDVFHGKIHARMTDPATPDGIPYTGEITAELDFSAWKTPGNYFLRIPGIGKSPDFPISEQAIADAFYLHAHGLYLKRCGIAKEKTYTAWTSGACHLLVARGVFPSHESHYFFPEGAPKRDYGFFDSRKKNINVEHFKLIRMNPPLSGEQLSLPGGWHDAADFDRRPQHLSIVGDLLAAYLSAPENFSDGQLNIPESGNGIPDIIDEAQWGLQHLRKAQLDSGAVGTWIETDHHPYPGEYLPEKDPTVFQIAHPTRTSTMEYAAYAAMMALTLREVHQDALARVYADSARKAWKWAVDPANRVKNKYYFYEISGLRQIITYTEPAELPAFEFVKASYDLAVYDQDDSYLKPVLEKLPELRNSMPKDLWRHSPFILIELERFARSNAALHTLNSSLREELVRHADQLMERLENSYPYRLAWYPPAHPYAGKMSWGTYHPLRIARGLLAAYAVTGLKRYRNAAYLANDFHNGANPLGLAMTSGLGINYPVRFLDLTSYADGIEEFVPGITPYFNTFGVPRHDVKLGHGLFYPAKIQLLFSDRNTSLLPESLTAGRLLSEQETASILNKVWPVFRRWGNVEAYTVAASEYTVWETIAPAMVSTGLLLEHSLAPSRNQIEKTPVKNITTLPGYAPLP